MNCHIPFLLLRPSKNCPETSDTTPKGHFISRRRTSLDFLGIDDSHANENSGYEIQEARFSLVIYGSVVSRWTAYAYVDGVLETDTVSIAENDDEEKSTMITPVTVRMKMMTIPPMTMMEVFG
jgi:hypothetical protein